ncbi:MAG: MFS transporter, partial [Acetobacteraceae bacterium]|nr:MFS transporter [Acetobacteraceae bacterium]
MLLTAAVINYMDRASLAVANPLIRHDLGLSVAEMGVLLSVFSFAYAAGQLPAGILVDRIGPRILLGSGVLLWSVAQALAGLSTNLTTFIWARIGLGIFESPNGPGGAKALSEWFHRRRRGVPIALVFSSGNIGSLIAPPFLTWLMLTWGWRTMFMVMGAIGAAYALVWVTVYRSPAATSVPAQDVAAIVSGNLGPPDRVRPGDWIRLFRLRNTWGLIGGFFGQNFLGWLYLTWLPGYLEIAHHMSVPRAGIFAAVPPFFGYLGGLFGGSLCDVLAARGVDIVASRRWPAILGVVGLAVFTLPVAFTDNTSVALALISAAVFCGQISGTTAWVLVTAVAPQRAIASLGSIQNCAGYIGAALAPAVTGFILQATGSFAPALLLGAVIALSSAASYLFVVRTPREPVAADQIGATP